MGTQLYTNLGFKSNPFSKKSSEQEIDFLKDIFYEPNYYETLVVSLGDGDSKFIIGQRGHGKTAIINNIYNDLNKSANYLVALIDRYESIPERNNECYFIYLIIQTIVNKLCFELYRDRSSLRALNKREKGKLCFFIQKFFNPISKEEFDEACDKVISNKRNNLFRRIYNKFIAKAINHVASAAVNVTSDVICRSLGLTGLDITGNFREYFPSLEEIQINKETINPETVKLTELKDVLYSISEVYGKIGKERIIILFDKIDEHNVLGQDVSKISTFIKDFLSDTELLLNPKIAIGFSLWSELKSALAGSVRFDKLGFSDVRWEHENMEPLMNKRLKYFSSANPIMYRDLIRSEVDQREIIELANKSPRDFIILMDDIYQEQANINPEVNIFDEKCIRSGMIKFCKNYDYASQVPSNSGKNRDIRAMINRLLKLKLFDFTYKDMSSILEQNDNQSEGQISLMIRYKMIREDELTMRKGLRVYEIIDPKIKFLIKHLVERIE